jgi:dTDP-4-dehydrorhamnose 3,5-epimerase-like enzyme
MTKIVKIKSFEDDRGSLIPIEFNSLRFEPKRVFIVNNVPVNMVRGNHSHHKTQQLIICINGCVDVILHDGKTETTTKLVKGEQILVPDLIWDSQRFLTKDSEIMVLCSTSYDYDDYIFDFEEFKKLKENQ